MNTVQLIGNVTKAPHFIEGNEHKKAVAFLTIANNDNKEKTVFTQVAVYNKTAEYVNSYIKAGARLAIEGKLATRPNKTKSGDTYQEQYIACHNLTNLSPKSED